MIPKNWKFPIKMESFHFTCLTFSQPYPHFPPNTITTFRQTLPPLSAKHYRLFLPNHHIPLLPTNYLRHRPGSNHQPLDPSPSALTTWPPRLSYMNIENHTIWLEFNCKFGIRLESEWNMNHHDFKIIRNWGLHRTMQVLYEISGTVLQSNCTFGIRLESE